MCSLLFATSPLPPTATATRVDHSWGLLAGQLNLLHKGVNLHANMAIVRLSCSGSSRPCLMPSAQAFISNNCSLRSAPKTCPNLAPANAPAGRLWPNSFTALPRCQKPLCCSHPPQGVRDMCNSKLISHFLPVWPSLSNGLIGCRRTMDLV